MSKNLQVYINPRYDSFRQDVVKVVRHEINYEQVYEDGRNFVARISSGGKSFVVKEYRHLALRERLLYSTLLKSKAQQAYEKASYLQRHGIETATPVACIVQYRHGLYQNAWFVSEYLPYIPYRRMWKMIKNDREHEAMSAGYAAFRKRMSNEGIAVTDLDPDNTLVYKRNDGYHFAQIDINRIKIRGRYFCLKRR